MARMENTLELAATPVATSKVGKKERKKRLILFSTEGQMKNISDKAYAEGK